MSMTSSADRCLPNLCELGFDLSAHVSSPKAATSCLGLHSQLMKQFSAILQVSLFQSNPHGQQSVTRDFGTSLPLLGPLWQLALVENMRGGHLAPGDRIMSSRHIVDGIGEWPCSGEGEAAAEDGSKLSEKHDEGR